MSSLKPGKKTTQIKPNIFKPRWRKVISDFWGDKTRTALVVSSVGVGVFAVGMILSAYIIFGADINFTYASSNPANIQIFTDPFEEDFIRIIEKIPGVEEVEGRHVNTIRVRRGTENWQSVNLIGTENLANGTINHLETIEGRQLLERGEVVFSQDIVNNTGFQVGDKIEFELLDGSTEFLTVVGLVTDQTTARPDPNAKANAFISLRSLDWLGQSSSFNRLLITVEGDGSSADFISKVAKRVEIKLEANRRLVYFSEETLSSEHPMSDSVAAIMGVLLVLAGLITILSGSLIINTLNALLTQQLRQIGVIKLIGGRSFQILGMYLSLIVIYSLIALVLAVPLGAIAGYALASFMARIMGAVIQGFRIIPIAVIVQVLIAFLIPLGAGFIPVNKGAKINVRRAISHYRPESQSGSKESFEQKVRWVRWISRPNLLSIRNTFRQRGRLLLTIFTLTVAGAVFIAVFNVRASMNSVMDQLMQHFLGDVTITFSQPYNISRIERDLLGLPGISGVEAWGGASGEIHDQSDELVSLLSIVAPPQDTQLLAPEFVAGRWLLPDEKKSLVISDTILTIYPNLQPGDSLNIFLQGSRVEAWEVVGIFRFVDMLGAPLAYADFDYIGEKVGLPNQAATFRIITSEHSAASQSELTQRINQKLADEDYAVQIVESGAVLRESASLSVNTLVIFLLLMAILTAFVGSIGLTGTMSINVLERTREIGVMRTIGAVDRVIMQSVIVEAMVIGIITWLLAIVLSFPISSGLLLIIAEAMAGSTFSLTTTPLGSILWLLVVIILSVVASILPARNAARLTINEVLAYE